jgi:hypothetical protein
MPSENLTAKIAGTLHFLQASPSGHTVIDEEPSQGGSRSEQENDIQPMVPKMSLDGPSLHWSKG